MVVNFVAYSGQKPTEWNLSLRAAYVVMTWEIPLQIVNQSAISRPAGTCHVLLALSLGRLGVPASKQFLP